MNNIIRYAKRYIFAETIKGIRKYIRQKLKNLSNLGEQEIKTKVDETIEKINEIFKAYNLTNQNYQNRAFDYIIQKTQNIQDKDQFVKLIVQDFTAIVVLVKQYQNIIDSHAFDNELNVNHKNIKNLTYDELFQLVNKYQEKIDNIQ